MPRTIRFLDDGKNFPSTMMKASLFSRVKKAVEVFLKSDIRGTFLDVHIIELDDGNGSRRKGLLLLTPELIDGLMPIEDNGGDTSK